MLVYAVVTLSGSPEPSQILFARTPAEAAFTVRSTSPPIFYLSTSKWNSSYYFFVKLCADVPLFLTIKIKQTPAIEFWIKYIVLSTFM